MKPTAPRTKNRPKIVAPRRGFLVALAAAPFTIPTAATSASKLSPLLDAAKELPLVLRRTREGRQLSRFRYHNAEGFFRSSRIDGGNLRGDTLYSFGIATQLGLSAHLLDVGFDDRWCARNIGLHVARSLAYANATGFAFDSADFALLAAMLSPYSKWRDQSFRNAQPDFPFTHQEVRDLVRALLDHVREVTGHPFPRGWRNRSA